MAFFNPNPAHLAPPALTRKRSQWFSKPPREETDDFLSSELELSFASTVSLHSPSRDSVALPQEISSHAEPMDISPAPRRPRAFTSGPRLFGSSIGNTLDPSLHPTSKPSKPLPTQSNGKRIQRSVLPTEWMQSANPAETQPTSEPASPMDDAMDVDTSFVAETNAFLSSSPVIQSAAPTVTFNNLFFDSESPRRSLDSPSAPITKKRRSLSPEHTKFMTQDNSSSPSLLSSPSRNKVDRMSGTTLFSKEKSMLEGLGNPPLNQAKRSHKLVFSTTVLPSETQLAQTAHYSGGRSEAEGSPNLVVVPSPPVRRAFSTVIPPSTCLETFSDESFMDGPDMSSPAQAYTKRQQVRTLRRRDGTEDFRPLTAVSPLCNRDSPSAKFLAPGLPGFGDNEAHGKVLPCHKVREDGLMRINCRTLDNLLDGMYNSTISKFMVIDCRFDYEYNGGHIPGAININTTAAVEEFLLGPILQKPKPSVSGDSVKKTVLVFHCEFSAKRAPTFAKHLRAKDRAMNNHFYPKIYYPEVYILEGGYCQYFKTSAHRCQPPAYVRMDDPKHLASRREDLDQFRKVRFGRYKSVGDVGGKIALPQPPKKNTAPSVAPNSLFAAANATRSRHCGGPSLMSLAEDASIAGDADDTDTDVGDSPCPPPTKTSVFKGKKLGRAPLARAETYGPIRMPF